ncbi:MAG: hypothetical protein KKG99_02320 [Bacteroidetes bacterium]|nr:hypothetical protein [Bacteroidota bacterium]
MNELGTALLWTYSKESFFLLDEAGLNRLGNLALRIFKTIVEIIPPIKAMTVPNIWLIRPESTKQS